MAKPPAKGEAKGSADGQSALARRMGIVVGSRVVLADAPPTFRRLLGVIPAGIKMTIASGAPAGAGADVIVCFPRSLGDYTRRLPAYRAGLAKTGVLWVVVPREQYARQHPNTPDLPPGDIDRISVEGGLRADGTLEIDQDAVALRFVYGGAARQGTKGTKTKKASSAPARPLKPPRRSAR